MIVNPKMDYVILSHGNNVLDTIKLDSKNYFAYKTDKITSEGLYTIKHNETQVFFAQPGDMHRDQRTGIERVQREVPIGDPVEAICGDSRKSEVVGHALPIKRVRGAGQRGRPQRHHIGAAKGLPHPVEIAQDHLAIGVHMMREEYWLRPLQVREARHDDIRI